MVVPALLRHPRTLAAVATALSRQRELFLVAQTCLDTESPDPQYLYDVGTAGSLLQCFTLSDGSQKVLVEGLRRAKVQEYCNTEQCLEAVISPMPSPETSANMWGLMRSVSSLVQTYVVATGQIPREISEIVSSIERGDRLAYIVAAHLPLTVAQKQAVLEPDSDTQRLQRLTEILQALLGSLP